MNKSQIIFIELSNKPIDSLFNKLLLYITNEKRQRVLKYNLDIDKKLSLYSDFFVRYKIWDELNIANKDIVFCRNKAGKPYLKDHSDFHFNISHTQNAIAIAFFTNEVGIDIEKIKTPEIKISKRFFIKDENDYILSSKNIEYAFYEIWTKKEAYIKYLGTGLSTPLKSFNVFDERISSMIYTTSINDYIISTCSSGFLQETPAIKSIQEGEIQAFYNKFQLQKEWIK